MQIVSIEPTPNPNSMKLNLDAALPAGVSLRFDRESAALAPAHVQRLLAIDGVKSVYQVADFIALERAPAADWQGVLAEVRQALMAPGAETAPPAEPPGRVNVFVQVFRGLPMQVKLIAGGQEQRAALPPRFGLAAKQAALTSPDFLAERKWVSRGARYGEAAEIAEAVVAEIDAAYADERLGQMLQQALQQAPGGAAATEPLPPAVVAERLQAPDWRQRYAALDQMEPEPEALTVVIQALADASPLVRRLATVYLGEIGGTGPTGADAVLPHLLAILRDENVAVRRAAGDCLSDLGDQRAIAPMATALRDPSKLVRWRAARFLYEVGDASALPALEAAQDDPEFEVGLQVRMAVERIAAGRGNIEPAWKQMTKRWDEQGGP